MVYTMSWKTRVVKLRQLVMGWTPLKLKPEPRHSSAGSARRAGGAPSGRFLPFSGPSLIGSRVKVVPTNPVREWRALVLPDAPYPLPSREDSEVGLGSPDSGILPLPSSPLAKTLSPAPRPGVFWTRAGVHFRGLLGCRHTSVLLPVFRVCLTTLYVG